MLIPFLIMLREGIEAALIVGIVASYLKQSGRGALMPAVWVGVLLATALSLFAGAGLQLLAAEFPQKEQELFEGVVGLIAVVMLTSMVFWMRKAARSIKGELQASIDKALHKGADGQGWALIGMVFLAVAREGGSMRRPKASSTSSTITAWGARISLSAKGAMSAHDRTAEPDAPNGSMNAAPANAPIAARLPLPAAALLLLARPAAARSFPQDRRRCEAPSRPPGSSRRRRKGPPAWR